MSSLLDDQVQLSGEDSDAEMDWEEVVPSTSNIPFPNDYPPSKNVMEIDVPSLVEAQPIEITIRTKNRPPDKDPEAKLLAAQRHAQRVLRLTCHKIHTVALLGNALSRNKMMNDPLLRARLMSLTPMTLQNAFTTISKKNYPDPAKRGRLFEAAMMRLTEWWYETFRIRDYGHIQSRTFEEMQNTIGRGEAEALEYGSEIVRGSKSLMKHALMVRGSRDMSAQLFTALCRALDIPARLIASLQSVPWQSKVGKSKPKPKRSQSKKGKEKADPQSEDEDESDDDMAEVEIPGSTNINQSRDQLFPGDGQTPSGASTPSSAKGKGKEKVVSKPPVRLRKHKPTGRKLGSSSRREPDPPAGGWPPVFWTEVFSRPDGRWMPVDPIRYIFNKRKVFEPPSHDRNNRMVYVVAIEEDGYARDVTRRYAKAYGAQTVKAQLGGKGRQEWWGKVMGLVTRPFRLIRDDVEDEEFENHQFLEGMPTSVVGFKDHPIFILERHLKRDEVIHPKVVLGKFRGEPVYPRNNVIPLKTAENWMRSGRKVSEGCQAMKFVKQRAMTINRKRAIELAQQEGEESMQGLYAESQTELYRPDPVVDGKIPKNEFGNIDLYVPSMLPPGAVHIPFRGTAKIARQLGFDYAEAVTNFEFKKGRAFPVINGIVVAVEHHETIVEAFVESERQALEKETKKKRDRVIKRWTRLIHGLQIRQRLQEQYVDRGGGQPSEPPKQSKDKNNEGDEVLLEPGGFLIEEDKVVQPFHLPKFQYGTYHPLNERIRAGQAETDEIPTINSALPAGGFLVDDSETASKQDQEGVQEDVEDDDGDMEMISAVDAPADSVFPSQSEPLDPVVRGAPKTMRELAEALATTNANGNATGVRDGDGEHQNGQDGVARRPTRAVRRKTEVAIDGSINDELSSMSALGQGSTKSSNHNRRPAKRKRQNSESSLSASSNDFEPPVEPSEDNNVDFGDGLNGKSTKNSTKNGKAQNTSSSRNKGKSRASAKSTASGESGAGTAKIWTRATKPATNTSVSASTRVLRSRGSKPAINYAE